MVKKPLSVPVELFECPSGCPVGQCNTKGPGKEGRYPCAHCDGSGIYAGGYLAERYAGTKLGEPCPYCKGDGLGGGFSTATCSKCGQSAMDRALWSDP
jgi:hypothetical protein